jgi:hypothetical protein
MLGATAKNMGRRAHEHIWLYDWRDILIAIQKSEKQFEATNHSYPTTPLWTIRYTGRCNDLRSRFGRGEVR